MKPNPAKKIEAFKQKMQRIRERGAKVVVRRGDGTVESVRHLRRLPDGSTQWTDEAGHPLPHPAQPHADDAA
jgi:hypothetical protein